MEEIILERLPVIALRGLTVFPGAVLHFDVGREKSVRALDRAMNPKQRTLTRCALLARWPRSSRCCACPGSPSVC